MLFVNFRPYTLSFEQAYCYSAILGYTRESQGATKKAIWRETGLHRTKTLPQVLQELLYSDLIVQHRKKYYAKRPPANIIWEIEGKNWMEGLGYFVVRPMLPDCPLNRFENVIFWKLRNLVKWKPRQYAEGLATLLGCSSYRVGKAFRKLKKLGLLESNKGLISFHETPNWWGKEAQPKRIDEPDASKESGPRPLVIEYKWFGEWDSHTLDMKDNDWVETVSTALEGTHGKAREKVEKEIYTVIWKLYMYNRIARSYGCLDVVLDEARRMHAATGRGSSVAWAFLEKLKQRAIVRNDGTRDAEPDDPFASTVAEWERIQRERR